MGKVLNIEDYRKARCECCGKLKYQKDLVTYIHIAFDIVNCLECQEKAIDFAKECKSYKRKIDS